MTEKEHKTRFWKFVDWLHEKLDERPKAFFGAILAIFAIGVLLGIWLPF